MCTLSIVHPSFWVHLVIFVVVSVTHNTSNAYLFPIAPRLPLPGVPSPPGSPWPLPQHWFSEDQLVSIGRKIDFQYESNVNDCSPLTWAFEKFNYDFLFGFAAIPDETVPILKKVIVTLPSRPENECNSFPRLETSDKNHESYNLFITAVGNTSFAHIVASTVWGALRGIETFTQLIFDGSEDGRHFYANVTSISDWPRFPHRGLMLDTARHYLPERIIHQILDSMFHNKLNVFHWHIVDDQSFPFVSKRFPELSEKGAYNKKAIYTPAAVTRVLEAARLRGIRVIFEFDTPGHTNAMGRGRPELLTPCYGDGVTPGTPNYPDHAPYEILDPTKETTYEFMKELMAEVHSVSYDDYIHLGMDEVYYPCWNSSPAIKHFMELNGYVNLSQVQEHYTNRQLQAVLDLGAKPIVWQDPMDAGVKIPAGVVIQLWKDSGDSWQNFTQKALDAGNQVILSSPWYLNFISYGEAWRNYYNIDPILQLPNFKPEQLEQVLGGEACIWGEFVDKTNIVSRIFPFAGAIAERLWSPAESSTANDAMWRLDQQRCRLLRRGIPAQPILNGHCGEWETENDEN